MIQQLITDNKDAMAKMDTSNPFVAQSMGRYTNYLSVLKGRQEKRYVDYINDSIGAHNADMQFMVDGYNTHFKQ